MPDTVKPSILCVGEDADLLNNRAMLLRSLDADAKCLLGSAAAVQCLASESFDLLVLCHTVKQADARAILNAVSGQTPPTFVLQVKKLYGSDHDRAHVRCDALVEANPALLIECVRQALHTFPARKSGRSDPNHSGAIQTSQLIPSGN